MKERDSKRGKYTSPEGSSLWEYISAMSCSLLLFCVGAVAGWSSPSLAILMKPDSPIPLDASDASTLSSMISVGHAIAPGLTPVMTAKLGRKKSLCIAGIPTIIGWGLLIVANNLTILLIARFVGGLSFGLILCLPAMYLGEIASARLRGTIGMVCSTMMCAGALFMFVVAPYLSIKMSASICLVISIISVVSVYFIPESPYALAMVGKYEKAEGVLEKLRGKTDVSEELEMIKATINQRAKGYEEGEKGLEDQRISRVLRQLFTIPENRKALTINLLFIVAIQLGSLLPIAVYGQIIIERMNIGIPAHLCAMIIAVLQLTSNILTALVIDKFGRRPLICISGISSGACDLTIGVYFYLKEYTEIDVTSYAMLALYAMFGNIITLNLGLAPIQQVIQSEIFAPGVKGLAISMIQVIGGILATIGLKFYLMIAETWNFGHCAPFLGYAVNSWICTAFILKLLPETKGKTLLEIQRDLIA